MRQLWKPSKRTIGDYPCIELRTVCMGNENVEYALAGPRGEIWEYDAHRYMAVVTSGISLRKSPQEQLVRFERGDLDLWIKRLGIPKSPSDQTPYANFFNL